MLSRTRVTEALHAKRDGFLDYERVTGQELERLLESLTRYEVEPRQVIDEALSFSLRPGARPTDERVAGQSSIRPFAPRWADHRGARRWALTVLSGVTTLAVDGSQITPSPDYALPVGAVQVGWFENPHGTDGDYVKDVHFEILTPNELYLGRDRDGLAGDSADAPYADTESDASSGDAPTGLTYPDDIVNRRRFVLECEVLIDHMRRYAEEGWKNPQRPPVCFFDGSLVISFAAQIRNPSLQRAYVAAVRCLLDVSRETRVPLVGYVDTSRARDLVRMLERFDLTLRPGASITDSQLLNARRLAWGDRSELLACARADGLFGAGNADDDFYPRIGFTYLKTARSTRPTRIEMPRWVHEAGLVEYVLDVIRAECIVGTGYPYALETADALAVITARDRERFHRLFQDFSERELGLPLAMGRKPLSKRARR